MKKYMWALYTTKNSKFPRHIYERHGDAKMSLFRMKEAGIHWGLIKRVMVEIPNETLITMYHHEFMKV